MSEVVPRCRYVLINWLNEKYFILNWMISKLVFDMLKIEADKQLIILKYILNNNNNNDF